MGQSIPQSDSHIGSVAWSGKTGMSYSSDQVSGVFGQGDTRSQTFSTTTTGTSYVLTFYASHSYSTYAYVTANPTSPVRPYSRTCKFYIKY